MENEYEKAYRHLRKDPVLRDVIKYTGKLPPPKHRDLFTSLLASIVSQQLSAKAADTIWNRFLLNFGDTKPDAESIINLSSDQMRAAGLSRQKAGYLKNIAEFSRHNTLQYSRLYRKSDEYLIQYLSSIKGVGRWTAEMILIFNLGRMDVFPQDDAGIRQAMVQLYDLKGNGKGLIQEMINAAEAWRPYRSLACRHLWGWKDKR